MGGNEHSPSEQGEESEESRNIEIDPQYEAGTRTCSHLNSHSTENEHAQINILREACWFRAVSLFYILNFFNSLISLSSCLLTPHKVK